MLATKATVLFFLTSQHFACAFLQLCYGLLVICQKLWGQGLDIARMGDPGPHTQVYPHPRLRPVTHAPYVGCGGLVEKLHSELTACLLSGMKTTLMVGTQPWS